MAVLGRVSPQVEPTADDLVINGFSLTESECRPLMIPVAGIILCQKRVGGIRRCENQILERIGDKENVRIDIQDIIEARVQQILDCDIPDET